MALESIIPKAVFGIQIFVFVSDDTVRKSLVPPYKGPYQVTARYPDFFKLVLRGKLNTVSIDRLKPAFGPVFISTVIHKSRKFSFMKKNAAAVVCVRLQVSRLGYIQVQGQVTVQIHSRVHLTFWEAVTCLLVQINHEF